MLIKALCEYADKRAEECNEVQIPEGWCEQGIRWRIMLTPDGDVDDIIDVQIQVTEKDKKGNEKIKFLPRNIILPLRTQKTGIDANIIEHRPLYIFGLNNTKNGLNPEDKTNKAKNSHEAFRKTNLEFFSGLDSELCIAYRRFIEKWTPENETQNEKLINLGKSYDSSYFGFALSGHNLNLEDDLVFREKYAEYCREKNSSADIAEEDITICGITGERLPVARIHDKIKFPGGNTVGCVLVGMKESAFESYGKKQSFNSNVSEVAMKKYTATFNKLLADKKHRAFIDEMVIVYFAMKANDDAECDFFSQLLGDSSRETSDALDKLFGFTSGGALNDFKDIGIDENVTFYVAGLTPNSSRICQKFIWRNKFGKMIENLVQHQHDLQINPENKYQIFFSRIAKELVSPKSTNEKVSPALMSGIMLAAFNGTNYPQALLHTVIRRVRTDSDEEKNHFIKLNDTRVGIIKACLNRKARINGLKEEFTMSLNKENNSPAYLCGRLFAVLEKIQQDSSGGGLNRTIKDSYFASACARPSSIMTKLVQLSQNHLRKLSEGQRIFYNKLIGEIINGIDGGFPQTLDLDSQGGFIIGYYQQNKALYTVSEKND